MPIDIADISMAFLKGTYLITAHAGERMHQRKITIQHIEEAIGKDRPKIINYYRYSWRILGWASPNQPLHVVVAFGTVGRSYTRFRLVTVYRPDEEPRRWMKNYEKERIDYRVRQVLRKCRSHED